MSGIMRRSFPAHEDVIVYLDGREGTVDAMLSAHFSGKNVYGFTVVDVRTQKNVVVERGDPHHSGVVVWREIDRD